MAENTCCLLVCFRGSLVFIQGTHVLHFMSHGTKRDQASHQLTPWVKGGRRTESGLMDGGFVYFILFYFWLVVDGGGFCSGDGRDENGWRWCVAIISGRRCCGGTWRLQVSPWAESVDHGRGGTANLRKKPWLGCGKGKGRACYLALWLGPSLLLCLAQLSFTLHVTGQVSCWAADDEMALHRPGPTVTPYSTPAHTHIETGAKAAAAMGWLGGNLG